MEVDMNRALFSPRAIALAALFLGAALAAPIQAPAQSVTVIVGGQPLYLNPGPIERAGRVFVPLRSIFERLGASVVYQSGTINATRHGQAISLQIGSTQATVNGQMQYLDVAPFIIGATTTCRFVSSRNRSARTSGTMPRRASSRLACRTEEATTFRRPCVRFRRRFRRRSASFG
jgi:hypothetical protein